MLTKALMVKIAVLLMLTLLFLSVAFGALVLADGGGGTGDPLPPDKSPSPGGDIGGYSLVISLLTTLLFVL